MAIYIVRHAFSEGNANRDAYRQCLRQIGLTPLGKLQAQEHGDQFARYLGAQMSGAQLRVFTSPRLRTVQTEMIFLNGRDEAGRRLKDRVIDRRYDELLNESEFGDFTGIQLHEFELLRQAGCIPSGQGTRPLNETDLAFMARAANGDMHGAKPFKGESGEEVCARIRRFITEHDLQNHAADVIIFTHSYTAKALVALLTGRDEGHCAEIYNSPDFLGNAEMLKLEASSDGHYQCSKLPIGGQDLEGKILRQENRLERLSTHVPVWNRC